MRSGEQGGADGDDGLQQKPRLPFCKGYYGVCASPHTLPTLLQVVQELKSAQDHLQEELMVMVT